MAVSIHDEGDDVGTRQERTVQNGGPKSRQPYVTNTACFLTGALALSTNRLQVRASSTKTVKMVL